MPRRAKPNKSPSPGQRGILATGLAAWLGWLFDGLDMHLYGLVASTFVASLLINEALIPADATPAHELVKEKSGYIQAAFLVGWALGGAFFGLLTYATYDLTNLAIMRDWPLLLTLVDLLWGSALCAVVAAATAWLASRTGKALPAAQL